MASAEELREAIQREVDKMNEILKIYDGMDLEQIYQNQQNHIHNMQAVRAWRFNINRNIRSINTQYDRLSKVADVINPQISRLNILLETTIELRDQTGVIDFNRLRSNVLNARRLLASLYNANEHVLPLSLKEALAELLQESRDLSRDVKKWRATYKERDRILIQNERRKEVAYTSALRKVNMLNDELPISGKVWNVQEKRDGYSLVFDGNSLLAWGNRIGIQLAGFLEDNLTDMKKVDIIDYITSNWGSFFADSIYKSVQDNSLEALGMIIVTDYRNSKTYQEARTTIFSYYEEDYYLHDQTIAFNTRIPVIILHNDASVPKHVISELQSYTSGAFSNTIDAQDQINRYHREFGTLPIELCSDDLKGLEREIRPLKRHLKDLMQLMNATTFGGQRNSRRGAILIDQMKEAIEDLARSTSKTKDFRNEVEYFKKICAKFKDWIDGNWAQFGGTPTGKVHSMGKSWAAAMGLS